LVLADKIPAKPNFSKAASWGTVIVTRRRAMMIDEIERMAFSVEEAAFRANIGRDGIYQAIRENRLEARKAGRRTLIPAEALRRFIQDLPRLQLPRA
jgi:excisionase family DNA binding protein